jgi:CRISPR system Cascade subunit CasE
MFISKVTITKDLLANVNLKEFLKDVYASHRLMWKLFPDEPESSRDFLFRQEYEKEQQSDSGARRGMPLFYMVSKRKPTPVPNLLSVITKPYDPRLEEGMKLGFILRANPVVARDKKGKKNSVRHDVLMDAKAKARVKNLSKEGEWEIMQQSAIDWLMRRSNDLGFTLCENGSGFCIEFNGYRQHRLYKPRAKQSIKFSSIDYQGTLQVTNAEKFRSILFEGIGKSKGFGCGLMMIRRI